MTQVLEEAPERLGPVLERLESWLGIALLEEVGTGTQAISPAPESVLKALFPFALSGSLGVFVALMNLLLFPVFTFYMLRDWDRLTAWLLGLVPPRNRARANALGAQIDARIGAFVWGQLLVAACLAGLYACGLWAIGLDSAIAIGVVAGFMSIVPYLGLVVGLALSLSLCALQFGLGWQLGATVGVFLGAQLVETLFITPKVMGEKVGLHPLVVMVVLISGGSLFGILGTIFAVPMAAAAQVVLGDFLREYRVSRYFRSGA